MSIIIIPYTQKAPKKIKWMPSRDMEKDFKKNLSWTSLDEIYTVWDEEHTGWD